MFSHIYKYALTIDYTLLLALVRACPHMREYILACMRECVRGGLSGRRDRPKSLSFAFNYSLLKFLNFTKILDIVTFSIRTGAVVTLSVICIQLDVSFGTRVVFKELGCSLAHNLRKFFFSFEGSIPRHINILIAG